MRRIGVVLSTLLAGSLLMIFAGSCGDRGQTLGPTEHQQLQSLSTPVTVAEGGALLEASGILIAFPETRYVRMIYDRPVSETVLSMLPDAARGIIAAGGLVDVDDAELAAAIAIVAGIDGSMVSGDVWIGLHISWGCAKCCFEKPPCCSPCPDCCSRNDDKDMYYIKAEEIHGL